MDKSLAHTKWNCKYHLIWIPKYRRKVIYGKYRTAIGQIIRQLCEYKGIEIVEANACVDHIHMLAKIPPKYSVSSIVGYLKGKSALMIFERFANLKYKFGNRHFWAKGYYVSTVGLNEATIKKYIREQENADQIIDKVSVKELEDPFRVARATDAISLNSDSTFRCCWEWALIGPRHAARYAGGHDSILKLYMNSHNRAISRKSERDF